MLQRRTCPQSIPGWPLAPKIRQHSRERPYSFERRKRCWIRFTQRRLRLHCRPPSFMGSPSARRRRNTQFWPARIKTSLESSANRIPPLMLRKQLNQPILPKVLAACFSMPISSGILGPYLYSAAKLSASLFISSASAKCENRITR